MSSFLEELGGITGGVGAEGLAFAAGFAAAHALGPAAEKIAQEAWHGAPDKRLGPGEAAEAAAERLADEAVMATEASYSGLDSSRFAYLYDLALTAPGSGLLIEMLRHGTISAADFEHGLAKAKLETRWSDALRELRTQRLTPQELALGVVRSTVADPGLLVVTLDTAGSTIPPYPQWPGDTLAEFAAGGVDKDRARVMVGSVGLPMSLQQAASATFRQIINRAAFNLAVLEGDTRPEYADAIFEQAREIPSLSEAIQYELRGFTDRAGRLDLTDLHGMTHAHSDVLYDVAGRAPSARQVYLGLARGAKYPSTYDDVPEPYKAAIQRSDIRPEFADIVYHNRFGEPSAFVVRALLRDGAISADRGATILENSGIPPDLATLVADFYAASGGTSSDPHLTKAQNQLWTTTHRSYVAHEISDPTATTALEAAGVDPASVPGVLALWQEERSLVRRGLTATNIRKAAATGALNPATGQPWNETDALARLAELGFDADDARTFMEIS